jgi:glycosyltransferase involved in cell wall biosynthesis
LKKKSNNTFVIVPVFNEEKIIGLILELLKKQFTNIVCIDDGSSDRSFDIIKSKNVYILKHLINLGQGAALQTGINFAILKGAKFFLTFDSDGQHSLKDAMQMIKILKKNKIDIIFGSRFLNFKYQKKIPTFRRLILKLGVILSNFLSDIKLSDTHNGLRVFNLRFAKKLQIKFDGMSHPHSFFTNTYKYKFKYFEYPTNVIYSKYSLSKGQKNINSINILFDVIFSKFR